MYKDIVKGNRSIAVSASVCHGKGKEGEALRGSGQRFREGSRGAQALHQASKKQGMVTSTGLGWSFSIQGPVGAFPESHTHLARRTSARVLQRSQLCCYGEAQKWCPSGVGCRWGGLPFSNPEMDEYLWCHQPGVKISISYSEMKQHCDRQQTLPKLFMP